MLGEKIKEMRLEKGMSINALSKEINVANSLILYIENDKVKNPGINTIYKILKGLNKEDIKINELVS